MFNIIIVIYNSLLIHSKSLVSCLESNKVQKKQIYVIDNSSDIDIKDKNIEFAQNYGVNYFSMNKNVGLSKAYNYALKKMNYNEVKWVMILDQDTFLSNKFFEAAEFSLIQDTDVLIHVPIIYSNCNQLSPLKFSKYDINRSNNIEPGIYSNLACINSGMIINSKVFNQIGLYDENLFLDCVDHHFCKLFYEIADCNNIKVFNHRLQQDFSANSLSSFQSDYNRFSIFYKDFKYYCMKNKISFFSKYYIIVKRSLRLVVKHRKIDFLFFKKL